MGNRYHSRANFIHNYYSYALLALVQVIIREHPGLNAGQNLMAVCSDGCQIYMEHWVQEELIAALDGTREEIRMRNTVSLREATARYGHSKKHYRYNKLLVKNGPFKF